MMGRTHAAIGGASLWALMLLPHISFHPGLVVVAAFSALLPDIDASESMIGQFTIGSKKGLGIQPLRVFNVIGSTLFRHRAVMHSLLVLALLVGGVWIWTHTTTWAGALWPEAPNEIPLAMGLGFLSHLVSDAMTSYGIPFLWPKQKRYHLLPRGFRVRLQSPEENAVLAIASVALMGWLIVTLIRFVGFVPPV